MHSRHCSSLKLPPSLLSPEIFDSLWAGLKRQRGSSCLSSDFLTKFNLFLSFIFLHTSTFCCLLCSIRADFFAMFHKSKGMSWVQSHPHCFWGTLFDYVVGHSLQRSSAWCPWDSVAKRNHGKLTFKKYHSLWLWGSDVSENGMYGQQYYYSTGLVLLLVWLYQGRQWKRWRSDSDATFLHCTV